MVLVQRAVMVLAPALQRSMAWQKDRLGQMMANAIPPRCAKTPSGAAADA